MEYSMSLTKLLVLMLNVLVGVAIPLGLYIFLRRKYMCDRRVFLAGCSTMVAFGLIVDLLVSNVFLPSPAGQFIYTRPWLYGLFSGLVVGLIHEPGRYLCIRLFLKEERWNDNNALMFGAGYGGMEALAGVLLGSLGNLIVGLMVFRGQHAFFLEGFTEEGLAEAKQTLDTLCNTSVYGYLMLSVGRCLSAASQMGLSILVWFAVKEKESAWKYLGMAMGMHMLLKAGTGILGGYVSSELLTQLLNAIITAGILYVAYRVWDREADPPILETDIE